MIFDECALKTLDVHQFAGALLLLHAALTLFLKMFHNEKKHYFTKTYYTD